MTPLPFFEFVSGSSCILSFSLLESDISSSSSSSLGLESLPLFSSLETSSSLSSLFGLLATPFVYSSFSSVWSYFCYRSINCPNDNLLNYLSIIILLNWIYFSLWCKRDEARSNIFLLMSSPSQWKLVPYFLSTL